MDETNYDLEQAHYHFTVSGLVHYIQMYGIDKVMIDVYDMLADECNTKVQQLDLEYHATKYESNYLKNIKLAAQAGEEG